MENNKVINSQEIECNESIPTFLSLQKSSLKLSLHSYSEYSKNIPRYFTNCKQADCYFVLDDDIVNVICKIQGGSNMTGTDLYKRTHKSVPVIFEPPCT